MKDKSKGELEAKP